MCSLKLNDTHFVTTDPCFFGGFQPVVEEDVIGGVDFSSVVLDVQLSLGAPLFISVEVNDALTQSSNGCDVNKNNKINGKQLFYENEVKGSLLISKYEIQGTKNENQ